MSIREGAAEILAIEDNQVFYNKAQVFNRDLSVLCINMFNSIYKPEGGVKILEGLAASGLRSIRYSKEIHGLTAVNANDIDITALEHMKINRAHNNVPESLMTISNADACSFMYSNIGVYNVIDLDPYGSASLFMDGAVRSVSSGGLLCVTCTDSSVLCGNNPEVCYQRYGGTALKGKYCHEASLRLMLHALSTSAAKCKRAIQPLASFSIDFYYRVFVRVVESPAESLLAYSKTSLVLQCSQCEAYETAALGVAVAGKSAKPGRIMGRGSCVECDSALTIGGPMWTGPIYDPSFLDACINASDQIGDFPYITSWDKIRGLLYGLRKELPDVPLFYTLPGLMSLVKAQEPKLKVFKAQLRRLGYRVSHSHRDATAIKTDAPVNKLFDVVRLWAKLKDVKPKEAKAVKILSKVVAEDISSVVDFDKCEDDEDDERPVAMFLPNPESHWGPKKAAKKQRLNTD